MQPLAWDLSARFSRELAVRAHKKVLKNTRKRLNNSMPDSRQFSDLLLQSPSFKLKE